MTPFRVFLDPTKMGASAKMKFASTFLVLSISCAWAHSAWGQQRKPKAEELMTKRCELETEVATLLHSVQSVDDITRMKKKLQALDKQDVRCAEEINALKLSKPDFERIVLEVSKRFKSASIGDEYLRLMTIPGTLDLVSDLTYVESLDDSNIELTKQALREYSKNLDLYKDQQNGYPKTLNDWRSRPRRMVLFGKLVRSDVLNDPWGRPYHYDVTGKHNKGKRPDIWSLGPPHKGGKSGEIGNWELPRQ